MSVNGFNWVENASQFSKDFAKNYHEDIDDRFLWSWSSISWKIKRSSKYLPFLPERIKTEKVQNVVDNLTICTIKGNGICYAHKKLKTSIKSWISIEKSA